MRTKDIENVGKRGREHRLFEMVGKFWMGDYLKEEGMEWGWEFLRDEKWMGLDGEGV